MSSGPYVLGGIAALAFLKAVWRPHRAIVKEGAVAACPGPNRYNICDPTLAVSAPAGTPVYSTVQGHVVAVGDRFVHIASRNESVVVMYDGIQPAVEEGQYVGRGQGLGQSLGTVYFGVTQFNPGGQAVKVDPASWLASRGQKIASKNTGAGTSWCEQGRHIDVPASSGRPCNLFEPEKAGFALLPVTVSVER
jgi:hypothetical protein